LVVSRLLAASSLAAPSSLLQFVDSGEYYEESCDVEVFLCNRPTFHPLWEQLEVNIELG
uniref:Cellulose synthase n=1 Tax=Taenia asiatica TaxID=60517 RepID=A0A0R3VW56_TAEAS